jgi:hypothetical protein
VRALGTSASKTSHACPDPGYFAHGGGTGHCRYFSHHIVLQIKAALTGQRLDVYTDTPSIARVNGGDVASEQPVFERIGQVKSHLHLEKAAVSADVAAA